MSNNVAIKGVHKGDTIDFDCVLYSDSAQTIPQDITGWGLRAEVYDSMGTQIKRANTAAGGDDSQIAITGASSGAFTVKILSDTTTPFKDNSKLEIEAEDPTGKKYTVSDNKVTFKRQKITWSTP